MIRSALAILGVAFILYWLSTSEMPKEELQEAFDPVPPKSLTLLPSRVSRFTRSLQARTDHGLREWLKHEAGSIGKTDPHPEQTANRLKERAAQLRSPDVLSLRTAALDRSLEGDVRFMAVYILGLSDHADAIEALKNVVMAPLPSKAAQNERAYSDELIIRFHALESAVKKLSYKDAAAFIKETLQKTPDASLAKHASSLLSR